MPEFGFEKGDVATLVDIVNDKKGASGYLLELFDSIGDTLKVVAVPENLMAYPLNHAVVN